MNTTPNPKNSPFFIINSLLCIAGTLVILWFAFGVEQQNSSAQKLFEWMLARSTPIIVGLGALMILILVGSYIGVKKLKGRDN
jgi:hypothetical protein